VAAWNPSLPWPGTAGGASSPHWGGYVRLFVYAELETGAPFTIGAGANDRLDAGNVLASAASTRAAGTLWHDLSCDVADVEIAGGAQASEGVFSKPDAATCVVTLVDPEGKYDPLATRGPFSYGGQSRLTPGVPVRVWAEVVDADDGTITTDDLFTGTADSWAEDWTPNPRERRARLVASDETKRWARYNRPEQPAVGNGDTTGQRVQRLVDFYGWPGVIDAPATPAAAVLQSTTLAQSGWELLNRALDDELGFVHFTRSGHLRWTTRDAWFAPGEPVVDLGCDPDMYDVLVDATPGTVDLQMRNSIHASRSGGTDVAAISTASVSRFGVYEYGRTDLGLLNEQQVGAWAQTVLELYAYPITGLDDIAMLPAVDARSWAVWAAVLSVALVTDLVRVKWAPPDRPDAIPVEQRARVIGFAHKISRASWEIRWFLVPADLLGSGAFVFTIGPHARDRLDAGNVLALT
jgi:hypothetical protein